MKKLFKLLLIPLSFIFIGSVSAKSIESINMDIYIDNNGTAHITEVWDANITQGTEGYRSYGNIGNAKITNFKVVDGDKEYSQLDSWNSSLSFEDKAYKSGINYSDPVELCWGISKYGHHTYKLTYDIEGFVADLEDNQMIYWTLIPKELAKNTKKVYIKIHSDNPYSSELPVWGYGNYGGLAYVYDGYIEMSNDSLSDGDYMTILVKFDKGTFNTQNVISSKFDYYYNMAEDGAEHYKNMHEKPPIAAIIWGIFRILINIFFSIFWVVIIAFIYKHLSNMPKVGTIKLDFGPTGSAVNKDTPMFRDLPCNKNIIRAYWVATQYGLVKKKTDFLGAIILKWLKQGYIKIENKEVGLIFKKEETTIVFNSSDLTSEVELENSLYSYMYEASKDGILESKEFEKWCSKNYTQILNWFDKIIDYETKQLVTEGKINIEEQYTTIFKIKTKVYNVDPSMMEEAKEMYGLKQFFNEFDNMTDKEAIDVMLWEEYLMYAQIFGVAKKVAEQFKKLYPDVITDYDYSSVVFVNSISYSGVSSATSARSRAESYSSGGGGFSSGGGGGGSFGSGGGGGFR